ncbi:MAG: rod shape-determining protein MreC [Christensenella sp.]|nr:rod shape-determining protein MreC [Christensenella sp.]
MGFFRNKPLIVTIVVIVVLVILLAVTGGNTTATESTNVIGGAFVPVQKFFYGISDSINSFFDGITSNGEAVQQTQQLDEELAALKGQMNNYDEMKAENERLREMLDYKQKNTSQELKVAAVTGKNPGNWFDVFTIDVGKNDGVEVNMPVITPDGLVGRVSEVGLNWAKVMAVIDGRSNVAAIMERTREHGVVKGSVSQNSLDSKLYMNYLPLASDVIEGDKVLTSGLDGLFPKGLLIGMVQTAQDSGENGMNVEIKSAVDFRRLEEVFVVLSVDGEATGAAETQQGSSSADIAPAPSTSPESGASASAEASAPQG